MQGLLLQGWYTGTVGLHFLRVWSLSWLCLPFVEKEKELFEKKENAKGM